MASYYLPNHNLISHALHQQHSHQQPHHSGRSKRAPRLTNNSHRQFRGVRSMKELTETPALSAFRSRFEAMRSFEFDDDLEFCPALLTDDDYASVGSLSDRSSLSSNSPTGSPIQPQIQPNHHVSPPFSLAHTFQPSYTAQSLSAVTHAQQHQQQQMKLHQPAVLRSRNAIPIVNPSTGMRVSSPPRAGSPTSRYQGQVYGRRW